MKRAILYHAGYPVCISAELDVLHLLPENQVEVIHFGTDKAKVQEAVNAGVQSVPALVLPNGNVLHINFGASIADLM